MLGSDRHGSASYMREEDPFPSLIGAFIHAPPGDLRLHDQNHSLTWVHGVSPAEQCLGG